MLDNNAILAVAGGAILATVFFALWLVQRRTKDASLVDVAWAAVLGTLAVWYAVFASGFLPRRMALAIVVGLWSLRLAAHIYTRHRGQPEDGRYRALRARWGASAHTFFFFFYQAQAALAAVLSLPFLLIAENRSPVFHSLEVFGVALSVVGVFGESVADRQLGRHRSDARSHGRTCRTGLWRYSRHPNYFFEWLIWCGVALAAFPAPWGPLALSSPLIMLFLIVKVTGIPPTEERSLATRGDDYRAYQSSTSAFVPWFPKKERVT